MANGVAAEGIGCGSFGGGGANKGGCRGENMCWADIVEEDGNTTVGATDGGINVEEDGGINVEEDGCRDGGKGGGLK
jgi:hypothetical protein